MVTQKKCNKCLELKSNDSFHKQNRNTDGLQSICKSCKKLLDKKWYQESDIKKNQQRLRRCEIIDQARIYKAEKGCKFCGENDAICLDFHHVEKNKEFTISAKIHDYSRDRIWKEIAKCDVLCANCHRKIHGGFL